MKFKRSFFAVAFIVIAMIVWSFMRTTSSNQMKKAEVTIAHDTETKPQTIKTDPKTSVETDTEKYDESAWYDCNEKLSKHFGADKCDMKCLATAVKAKDRDLAAFIEEDWLSPTPEGKNPQSQYGKFFQAMYLGNFNSNEPGLKIKDLRRSEKLLRELSLKDPNNAFPDLFLAMILQRQGKTEEAKKILREAMPKKYHSYLGDINRKLFLNAGTDIALRMKAGEIFGALPFPDYKTLETLAEVDEDAFINLNKKILKRSLVDNGRGFDMTWVALEHQFALKYLKALSPTDAALYPDYKEILENSGERIENWEVLEKGCHPSDMLEDAREELKRIKALSI